jgi:membrane protein required for colicin V production
MTFTWLDYVILAIVLISTLVSLFRGFVREAMSLAFWVIAFWVAQMFFREVAVSLEQWIPVPSLRLAAAFAIIFFVVLLLGGLITFLFAKLIDATGLSGTDRVIGMLFGATRGALLVAGLVLLAGLTPMPNDPWWKESQLVGHFEELAVWLRGFLPQDFAERIRLSAEGLTSGTDVKVLQPPVPPNPKALPTSQPNPKALSLPVPLTPKAPGG